MYYLLSCGLQLLLSSLFLPYLHIYNLDSYLFIFVAYISLYFLISKYLRLRLLFYFFVALNHTHIYARAPPCFFVFSHLISNSVRVF